MSQDTRVFMERAKEAAMAAGGMLRASFGATPEADSIESHDIKIELDRRSQTLIESLLLAKFPDHAIYGEEGIRGAQDGEYQWVIDPIDGTVNYYFGIPHFCVSIALRRHGEIQLGVIYDPMRDELWSVECGAPALLNGLPIRVSERVDLGDSVVTVGFSKSEAGIEKGLPLFNRIARSAKKCRMLGSAALDLAYVASGRLDAYIESQISLWDIAAGWLLIEQAGGKVEVTPHADAPEKFAVVATNGRLRWEE